MISFGLQKNYVFQLVLYLRSSCGMLSTHQDSQGVSDTVFD